MSAAPRAAGSTSREVGTRPGASRFVRRCAHGVRPRPARAVAAPDRRSTTCCFTARRARASRDYLQRRRPAAGGSATIVPPLPARSRECALDRLFFAGRRSFERFEVTSNGHEHLDELRASGAARSCSARTSAASRRCARSGRPRRLADQRGRALPERASASTRVLERLDPDVAHAPDRAPAGIRLRAASCGERSSAASWSPSSATASVDDGRTSRCTSSAHGAASRPGPYVLAARCTARCYLTFGLYRGAESLRLCTASRSPSSSMLPRREPRGGAAQATCSATPTRLEHYCRSRPTTGSTSSTSGASCRDVAPRTAPASRGRQAPLTHRGRAWRVARGRARAALERAPGVRARASQRRAERRSTALARGRRRLRRDHRLRRLVRDRVPASSSRELPLNLFRFHGCGAGRSSTPRRARGARSRASPRSRRAARACASTCSSGCASCSTRDVAAVHPGRRLGRRQRRSHAALLRRRRAGGRARGALSRRSDRARPPRRCRELGLAPLSSRPRRAWRS